MNWPMMLLTYVARRFTLSVLIVISVFAVVAFSIDLADMFRRTSERDVATAIVISMSAFKLADIVQQLFPFAVLFSLLRVFHAAMNWSPHVRPAYPPGNFYVLLWWSQFLWVRLPLRYSIPSRRHCLRNIRALRPVTFAERRRN